MEEMQNKAVVFFVFYIWSTVEIFRWVEMPEWCLSAPPTMDKTLSYPDSHLIWDKIFMYEEFYLHLCALQSWDVFLIKKLKILF